MVNLAPKWHARLRELPATLRTDLHVSRQTDRSSPVYVIHDPVSFRTHRLDARQYKLATALNGQLALGDVFDRLVEQGVIASDEEPFFYDLVSNLYSSELVVLPIHSGDRLYDRSRQLKHSARKNRLLRLLFLRIPLSNPDRFLTRTAPYVNWLFTRAFGCVWLVCMLIAMLVVLLRLPDFVEPLNGVLSAANLPILWCILITLKIWHELGHGYACKRFGGRVPEMGAILVVGNPLAYVEATAAWSFRERWKRLIVIAGGMYFESLVAIPALFIWAVSSHTAVGAIAYQVVITATVVTLLFNANPLMKFDGYFALSEMLRLPNLRARADHQVKVMAKFLLLGIRPDPPLSTRRRVVLLTYGVSSATYRVVLVLSIAMLIAMRLPLVGLVIAFAYVAFTAVHVLKRVAVYLLRHEETLARPLRARTVAGAIFVGVPIAVALLPIPFDVVTWGVIGAQQEHIVRVTTAGEFQGPSVQPGQLVSAQTTLAHLRNPTVEESYAVSLARLQEARLRWQVARERHVVESARIEAEIQALESRVADTQFQIDALQVEAKRPGRLVKLTPLATGQYLPVGAPVAFIVDGPPILRAWVTQEELNNMRRHTGTAVRLRLAGNSRKTFRGKLARIRPAAETAIHERALTHLAGGELLVHPDTGQPLEALFQLDIVPTDQTFPGHQFGQRVALAIPRGYESIGSWSLRKCMRFVQQLLLTS